jgi:hypothetical protein
MIKSGTMGWAGPVARMRKLRHKYKILVEKPGLKRPLGKPKRRWEDNAKMGLGKIGLECANWIHLVQDRDRRRAVVNTVMNLAIP